MPRLLAERSPQNIRPSVCFERALRSDLAASGTRVPLAARGPALVPQFHYTLHDISALTGAEIRGAVLTRLGLLALHHIFSDAPLERLRELETRAYKSAVVGIIWASPK